MRILVAEDDARLRRHLVAALREGGHEVDETGDGIDALAVVEQPVRMTPPCWTSRCPAWMA